MALHCALSVLFFFDVVFVCSRGKLESNSETSELKIKGMVGRFLGPLLDPPLL